MNCRWLLERERERERERVRERERGGGRGVERGDREGEILFKCY